jgi:hypothetical protein
MTFILTILTILGSRGVTVGVGPSALCEAPDGVAITYGLYDGPLTFTITAQEAGQLAAAITTQLATNRANPDAWPRRC